MKKTRKMRGKRTCSLLLVFVMVLTLMINIDITELQAAGNVQYETIEIAQSCLNGNAIWGLTETWSSSITLDNCAAFYAHASNRNNGVGGLPVDGKLTTGQGTPYQLATGGSAETAYDGNDCIKLNAGCNSKTMNLQTIGVYNNIYVLATAGGINAGNYAEFKVTLQYTDGSFASITYKLYDWYDLTDVSGVEKYYNVMRRESGGYYSGTINNTKGPILHSATIPAENTKLLQSIKFELTGVNGSTTIPSNFHCGIFAVTGATPSGVTAAPVATAATKTEGDDSGAFYANWESVEGATGYRLDVATDRKFTNILSSYNNLDVGNVTSFLVNDSSLQSDTVYYYRVRAVNSNGQSLSSNRISTDLPLWLKSALEEEDYDNVSYDAETNTITFEEDVTLKDTIVLPEEDTTIIDVGNNTVTAPQGEPAISAGDGSNVGLSIIGSQGSEEESGGIVGNGCDANGNGVPTVDFSNATGNSTIDLENISVTGSSGNSSESESGDGGKGGAGIAASGNTKIEVGAGSVVSGGDGGNASSGNGGDGGAGISGGNVVIVDTSGSVNGGNGGDSQNGNGGDGGQGINSSGTPSNSGNVSGGNGGDSQNGNGGDGGQGIVSNGNPSNSGNVSGGDGGNGSTPGTGGTPGASGGTSGQQGHTHNWATTWTTNSTHHWHVCEGDGTCSITNEEGNYGYGEHIYDNASDATCNVCGYRRAVNSSSESSDPEPTPTPSPSPSPSPLPVPSNVTDETNEEQNEQGAGLDNSISELVQNVLTEEDRQRVASGESVKIWLLATEGQPTEEEQNLTETILQTALPEYNMGTYLDLSLWKQFSSEQPTIIHETSGNVTVKFQVPQMLINTDSAVVRTYQIIRVHEGVTDVLPCSYDVATQTVTFETDRFSCYALIYTDEARNNSDNPLTGANPSDGGIPNASDSGQLDDVPKTGVTSSTPIWLALMIISGIGIIIAKKRSLKKQ